MFWAISDSLQSVLQAAICLCVRELSVAHLWLPCRSRGNQGQCPSWNSCTLQMPSAPTLPGVPGAQGLRATREREIYSLPCPSVLFTDLLPWTEVEVDFFFFFSYSFLRLRWQIRCLVESQTLDSRAAVSSLSQKQTRKRKRGEETGKQKAYGSGSYRLELRFQYSLNS